MHPKWYLPETHPEIYCIYPKWAIYIQKAPRIIFTWNIYTRIAPKCIYACSAARNIYPQYAPRNIYNPKRYKLWKHLDPYIELCFDSSFATDGLYVRGSEHLLISTQKMMCFQDWHLVLSRSFTLLGKLKTWCWVLSRKIPPERGPSCTRRLERFTSCNKTNV